MPQAIRAKLLAEWERARKAHTASLGERCLQLSGPIALAEAKPVGFAVGGEGEDRLAGEQAVGLVKIPWGDQAVRNVVVGRGPSGLGEQPRW